MAEYRKRSENNVGCFWNGLNAVNIFAKCSMLDVWKGSEYVSIQRQFDRFVVRGWLSQSLQSPHRISSQHLCLYPPLLREEYYWFRVLISNKFKIYNAEVIYSSTCRIPYVFSIYELTSIVFFLLHLLNSLSQMADLRITIMLVTKIIIEPPDIDHILGWMIIARYWNRKA